jgi:hypothetical protein
MSGDGADLCLIIQELEYKLRERGIKLEFIKVDKPLYLAEGQVYSLNGVPIKDVIAEHEADYWVGKV